MDNLIIESVNEILLKVSMNDGSTRMLKFIFDDTKMIPDECSLAFDHNLHEAKLTFNWEAFTLEMLQEDE